MADTIKLKQEIAKSGLKTSVLCERIGMSPQLLHKRLTGNGEFTVSQAQALSDALRLTSAQFKEIFFA